MRGAPWLTAMAPARSPFARLLPVAARCRGASQRRTLMSETTERDERHLARMQRKKAIIDERIANSPTNAACCWC